MYDWLAIPNGAESVDEVELRFRNVIRNATDLGKARSFVVISVVPSLCKGMDLVGQTALVSLNPRHRRPRIYSRLTGALEGRLGQPHYSAAIYGVTR